MSAIVLGKRSFFEELSNINSSAPSSSSPSPSSVSKSKRFRFSSSSSSSSSPSFNPFSSRFSHLLLHLASLFPDMDNQVLERALEECGEDLDSAIKSLNELRLGSVRPDDASAADQALPPPDRKVASAQASLPVDGAEWVELFVREMMSASDMDDARARASRALEALEKSICAREAGKNSSHQESIMLKEQVQALIQENAILKRAVAIQHERQKESDNRSQELQQLKELVAQYQEQVRTLEINNYALTMHLKQAQQSSSIPGHFHPDVF